MHHDTLPIRLIVKLLGSSAPSAWAIGSEFIRNTRYGIRNTTFEKGLVHILCNSGQSLDLSVISLPTFLHQDQPPPVDSVGALQQSTR